MGGKNKIFPPFLIIYPFQNSQIGLSTDWGKYISNLTFLPGWGAGRVRRFDEPFLISKFLKWTFYGLGSSPLSKGERIFGRATA